MTLDGYNQTYDPAEISEAGTDLAVEVFSGLIRFGMLLVLIIIWKLLSRRR